MTRPTILALTAFHNELRWLPGLYENLSGRVDGVVALDDGSSDGSGTYASSRPETAALLRTLPENKTRWDEPGNRRLLVTAGQELGADWFLAIDADERTDDCFWEDLDELVAWSERERVVAWSFRLRELWNSAVHYRADGIWGCKTKAAWFRNLGPAHKFDDAEWHGEWVPMQVWQTPVCRVIPYDLYHLKMIDASDRAARRARYESLDPGNRFQSIGYGYLTEESGLRLEPIGRSYRGMPGQEAS